MAHLPVLPVWWELDGTSWNTGPDAAGNRLLVERATGWTSSAPPRPSVQPRPTASGAYRGPNYRGPKIVELAGKAEAVTPQARETLADQIAALCLDPDTLYPLTRHEHARTLTMWVQLNDVVSVVERPDGLTLDVNVQVIAADPTKYSPANASQSTGIAMAAEGGIAWNGSPSVTGGVEWNGSPTVTGGLIYQDGAGDSGTIVLANTGTAWAPITFTITPESSVTNPSIANVDTGERITYGGVVTSVLTINTGTGRTELAGGLNVGGALTSADFFLVPPRSSIRVVFSAAAGSGAAALLAVNSNAFA